MADITPNSKVPLGWTIALFSSLLACAIGGVGVFMRSEHEKALAMTEFRAEVRAAASEFRSDIKADLQGIRFELKQTNEGRWTREDTLRLLEALGKLNPTLVMPEVPR